MAMPAIENVNKAPTANTPQLAKFKDFFTKAILGSHVTIPVLYAV